MLYTLTGNLLAERTLEFAAWEPGRTQRARKESFQVGGKGINVAKMLARLGTPCTALAFTGGASGSECESWLKSAAFDVVTFPSSTSTRTGLVVRSEHQPETTFLGPDAPADPEALAACAHFIERLNDGDVLALCGSFPGWSSEPAEAVRFALERFAHRGFLLVDSYGPPLCWAVKKPLSLLKINRTEFNDLLVNRDVTDLDRAVPQFHAGASPETWIITDGKEPVFLKKRNEPSLAFTPPVIRELSATGSGDVFLAGLMHAAFSKHLAWPEAIRLALPLAAANAAHAGVADFSFDLSA